MFPASALQMSRGANVLHVITGAAVLQQDVCSCSVLLHLTVWMPMLLVTVWQHVSMVWLRESTARGTVRRNHEHARFACRQTALAYWAGTSRCPVPAGSRTHCCKQPMYSSQGPISLPRVPSQSPAHRHA